MRNALAREGLTVAGAFAPAPHDRAPYGTRAILLVGPDGPAFWDRFRASVEYGDGMPDPLDRWSRRILGRIAAESGGMAMFPFDGPPWHPFRDWALRAGAAQLSPVSLLVSAREGLWVSFRGALAVPFAVTMDPAPAPCPTCAGTPCRTACPVDALGPDRYDVAACRAHVGTAAGAACLDGCLVRRACPPGAGRQPQAQSAFHMASFRDSGL